MVVGVEGAAGTGKTYRLMELLAETLDVSPLAGSQKILALTFMHGSRRRLCERLSNVRGLGLRFDCLTFDGFAYRLQHRWASLAKALSIPLLDEADFDGQCEAAGILLERDEVRAWVATSYPVLVVDEAQDLNAPRLRLLRALSRSLKTLVAADEFQCLDTSLLPAPAVEWMRSACKPETLTIARRTSQSELLVAAGDIRAGRAPQSGGSFQVLGSKGDGMSAAHLARTLALGGTRNVAILTPSRKSGWAPKILELIGTKPYGKGNFGPHAVRWERSYADNASTAVDALQLADVNELDDTLRLLKSLPDSGPVRATMRWVHHRRDALGIQSFSRAEIIDNLGRNFQSSSRYDRADRHTGFITMTVHQAKNREFDGVVVMWPYAVGGNDDGKRRLLYNAVTRAKRWCTVIVQNDRLRSVVPFR